MSTAETPPVDLRHVNVTIKPAAPKIQEDIFLVATIECPQMGLPEAHLVFAPKDNALVLLAPCGCSVQVRLNGLILDLSNVAKKSHQEPQPAGGVH